MRPRHSLLAVWLSCHLSSCTAQKPPARGAPTTQAIIEFSIQQVGQRHLDGFTVTVSLQNRSEGNLYVSFGPHFDWIAGGAMTSTSGPGQATSIGMPFRPSLLVVQGEVCPNFGSAFLIRRGEILSRVVMLEIPAELRSARSLEVSLSFDVPVFDSSFACKERPWVSGTASTMVQ